MTKPVKAMKKQEKNTIKRYEDSIAKQSKSTLESVRKLLKVVDASLTMKLPKGAQTIPADWHHKINEVHVRAEDDLSTLVKETKDLISARIDLTKDKIGPLQTHIKGLEYQLTEARTALAALEQKKDSEAASKGRKAAKAAAAKSASVTRTPVASSEQS